MARATFLLPTAARFGKQRLSNASALAIGRSDRRLPAGIGRREQLRRHFQLTPDRWPIAALMRQAEAGDAAGYAWLRADPAHVRPDINGARLMAYSDTLGLDDQGRAALLPALKPLFDDAGFVLDATAPSHWYLRLPREAKIPRFADPDEALGEDVFDHLAQGDEGRRWRTLLSEAQVVLHNHPWNELRAARGLPAVNSLWFWGGGVLSDECHSSHAITYSDEETAVALAAAAGIFEPLPPALPRIEDDVLFDLHAARDLARLEADWVQPGLEALHKGALQRLELDFEDGYVIELARVQRWRVWRKPVPYFGA